MINIDCPWLSSPVVWWTGFCDDDLVSLIKHTTQLNQPNFVPTTVSTGEPDFRKSLVCWHYHFDELYRRFTDRIEQVLPQVKEEMGDFAIQHPHTKVEIQMTTHGQGDNFKRHIDNASHDTYGRGITFVYYYRLTEKQNFSGGDLVIHLHNGDRRVEPRENTIVLFPSHLYHTVEPVQVPAGSFEDGRFTLNGWIHR